MPNQPDAQGAHRTAPMTPEEREHLEKRADALKQEIATLKEAITDIASPAFHGQSKEGQLRNLKIVLVTREQELADVEDQLRQGSP